MVSYGHRIYAYASPVDVWTTNLASQKICRYWRLSFFRCPVETRTKNRWVWACDDIVLFLKFVVVFNVMGYMYTCLWRVFAHTLMSSLTKRNFFLEQADFNGFIVSPSIFWNTTSTQVCMICHRNDGRSVWLEGVTTTSLKGREPTSSRPGSARAQLKQKWCSQSFSRSWCLEASTIKTILKAQNYLKRTAICMILLWVLKPMKIARDEFVSAFRCCCVFNFGECTSWS